MMRAPSVHSGGAPAVPRRASSPLLAVPAAVLAVLLAVCPASAKESKEAGKAADDGNRKVWLDRAKRDSDVILGTASWYDEKGAPGGETASGAPFSKHRFTAAHRTLPFGTVLRVTDRRSGRSVMVCVTDRGPFVKGRTIDLSYAAAGRIGLDSKGVSAVSLEVVSDAGGRPLDEGDAFYVDLKTSAGPERFGPYDTFADASAVLEALMTAHPEAAIVLAGRETPR